MLNKRVVLLLLALIIISVSGCVIFEKYKMGWDWEKYKEYSEFYDKINKTKPSSTDSVEDFMVGMSQDTEFDKTWYLTFLNFNRGIEAKIKMREQQYSCAEDVIRKGGESGASMEQQRKQCQITDISKKYFEKSNEYRQRIEEMMPLR